MKKQLFLLICAFFLLAVPATAQSLLMSNQYPLVDLQNGDEVKIADPQYAEEIIPATAANYKSSRRFRVELNYNRNNHSDRVDATPWQLFVTVTSTTTAQIEVLKVEYSAGLSAAYSGWADFSGSPSRMEWKVSAITPKKWSGSAWIDGTLADVPLADIHLETMVFNERIVDMSSSPLPRMEYNSSVISWDYVPGAVEYDVEWVFIQAGDPFTYSASSPEEPFSFKEPVRITTYKHSHQIDRIFPEGKLYFRIRAKGYFFKPGNRENYYHGAWSYLRKGTGSSLLLPVTISADFEGRKNWQYTVAYAENGMSKSTITYFDGSLRARQQLSQLKSTGQVVASGTLYDYEGREAVQVIPTPINTNSLTYYQNLHRIPGSPVTAFDKTKFDEGVVSPMGTGSGAGAYYSTSNPFSSADPFRERIPNAEGYPFTQTTFINDNTGRPRSTSGVGYAHRKGGGHETFYYYVKPTERSLHELFGSNVGDVSHYDKQVTVDPNGQASVVYTDQLGRVIASGLYGGTPANLLPLDNNPDGALVQANLNPSSIPSEILTSPDGLYSQADYYHLNIGTNTITLKYDVLSGAVNQENSLFGPGACASCYYELEIQVFDPNGNPVNLAYTSQSLGGGPQATVRERYAEADLDCLSPTYDPGLLAIELTPTLTLTGEYHIHKILRVDTDAVSAYIAAHAKNLAGAPDSSDIVSGYTSNVVTSGCGFDCQAAYAQECRESLGYAVTGVLTPEQILLVDACILDKCAAADADAIEDQEEGEDGNACDMLLGMLREDLSPEGWVFESYQPWRTTTANWLRTYQKAGGGTFTPTSLEHLAANWENGWETAYLTSHPEYCQYDKCLVINALRQHHVTLNNVATLAAAVAQGYINTSGAFLTNDPLFTHPQYSATAPDFLNGALTSINYNFHGASGNNVKQYVISLIAGNPDLGKDADENVLTGAAYDDRVWQLMRSLYLGDREQFMEDHYAGCPYIDHPDANFVDPEEVNDPNSSADVPPFLDPVNGDCPELCQLNVEQWIGHIQADCPAITAATLLQVRTHLQNYCLTDCDGVTNILGSIQLSDLNAGNASLVNVQSLLGTCFQLSSISEDDTCANMTTVSYNQLYGYGLPMTQRLAVLGYLKPNAYTGFITTPTITALAASFPESYWNSGMQVRLTKLLPSPVHVLYNIANLADIAVVSEQYAGSSGEVLFTVRVTQTNGTITFHTIDQFSLSKVSGGWQDFSIDRKAIKYTVTKQVCADGPTEVSDIPFSLEDWITDCISDIHDEAEILGTQAYAEQFGTFAGDLAASFSSQCFGTGLQEQFVIYLPRQEYAFTLYYYDQAGNLVQTIPPQGVHPVPASGFGADGHWLGTLEPTHLMATVYKYNSLGQPVQSRTPDGGLSEFWYNDAQQMRYSRSAAQAVNNYAYLKYDAQGRTIESGVFTGPVDVALTNRNDNAYPVASTGSPSKNMTRTFYEQQPLTLASALNWAPGNLNTRIAAIATYASYTGTSTAYTNALFYDYDIHGNVKKLLTDFGPGQGLYRYKTVDYDYDLYSGKMREVRYQDHHQDQLIHRYTYDDDHRLISVFTSRDGIDWDEDATYYYYLHGPLARMELGDQKVQGVDYAYTIHGWLKGVNSNTLTAVNDLGRDGSAQSRPNRWVARDAFGYSLTYYNQGLEVDYKPISTLRWLAANENTFLPGATGAANLYNGNIRAMVTALQNTSNALVGTVARVYQYDQLQRLKTAQTWKPASTYESANSWTGATTTQAHYSAYSYDLNGNLTRLTRNGSGLDDNNAPVALLMDDFTYQYENGAGGQIPLPTVLNRLSHVSDVAPSATYATDIDPGQTGANYIYDAQGRLIQDVQEQIALITWRADNKVERITRTAGSTKPDLQFVYDGMGHRVQKITYVKLSNGSIDAANSVYTYYALDAQGNTLATYTKKNTTGPWFQTDFVLYGKQRLGTLEIEKQQAATPVFGHCSEDNRASAIFEFGISTFTTGSSLVYKVGTTAINDAYVWTGTPATDVKNLIDKINAKTAQTDLSASLWWSNQSSTSMYYVEIKYSQPGNWGGEAIGVYLNGATTASTATLHVPKRQLGYGTCRGANMVGERRYELSNHLNNVLSVITDRKAAVDDGVYNLTTGARTNTLLDGLADYYLPTIVSYADYEPFGMVQDHRHAYDDSYRYGFQGQERDDELKGPGNSINYEYRMHDPRVGRFFAVDPLAGKYPHNSPYAFSENVVINAIELEGAEQLNIHAPLREQLMKEDALLTKFGMNNVLRQSQAAGALIIVGNLEGTVNLTTAEGQMQLFAGLAAIHAEAAKDPATHMVETMNPSLYYGYKLFFEGDVEKIKSGNNIEMMEGAGNIALTLSPLLKVKRFFSKPLKEVNVYPPHIPAWKQRIFAGNLFEKRQLKIAQEAGLDAQGQIRLVPQNGKGNVKGNRTDADILIKNSDNTFSLIETKLSWKQKLRKGQAAAEEQINQGNGIFEVRTENKALGLEVGQRIKIRDYQRVNAEKAPTGK